ncbi:rhodanese-like domain-containing protein [Trichocoleus desertorum AS-A10]|uniref:rhodanese-like domain-containing protein n=1 Tax=Trichocoleus desertorum TaxID=1481672 RepID=UPI003299A0EB
MINSKLTQFSKAFSFFDLFSTQISAKELHDFIQNHSDYFLLIDVRNPLEYEQDHIPHAILMPLSEIEQGKGIEQIQLVLKERHLIAYCTVGKRSQKALHALKSAGISGLNLRGGIRAWHHFAQSTYAQAESGISP